MRIRLFYILSFLPLFHSFSQTIRINEAISSNSVFIDEDGDSPDWFELYNYGSQEISLNNWTVSDKDDNPDKWTFPDISIRGKTMALAILPRPIIPIEISKFI